MLFALGAVSSALDAIQSLTGSNASAGAQKSGSAQGPANPFAIDSSRSTSAANSSVQAPRGLQISPETMNALFAAQSQSSGGASGAANTATSTASTPQSRDAALKDLFSQLDADGDGSISKTEFEDALGAGGTNLAKADDVFAKLDANSDGDVSLDEMSKALKSGHHGHHHAEGAGASGDGSDSSSKSGGGSTSTTTTNADGSTTTTVSYADGFKMSTTVPGASSHRNSAYDLFAQLMQQQGGQGQSASAGSSMSMSV